ncbi:AAA family ATPase [Candidatus Deianiraea vastatrix]|uniref:DNA repair protein RecN n=1 Tax=Candidatus Deianiraea vastatrix TaxID=2163644 RepID=A0A5B8XDG3_9RICK|nr:AAA family ATPase [Candidatus Deianiraea vastatrix]QED23399.1 DNA repair protein RecN [Candidatus Deianiraea vastatrix]
MLRALYIENIVLIERAEINFAPGMTSITGDSGSGKSVILDSINIIVGDRASQNVIRNGATRGVIWAEFDISKNKDMLAKLEEFGYDVSGILVIKKVINKDSGSKIFINDMPSSVSFIRDLTTDLIEIHGQMSQLDVLSPACHIGILDKYIQNPEMFKNIKQLSQNYKEKLAILLEKRENLAKCEKEINELEELEEELAKYEIGENEEREVISKRADFLKANRISESLLHIVEKISSLNIASCQNAFSKFSYQDDENPDKAETICTEVEKSAELLDAACENIIQAKDILENLIDDVKKSSDLDINELEERMDLIRSISQKYRIPSGSFYAFTKEIREKIDNTYKLRGDVKKYEDELENIRKEYEKSALELDKIRRKSATEIEEFVNSMLTNLEMKEAIFKIEIENISDKITEIGSNSVRFMACLNRGSKTLPIDEIASGGEISRLILALKAAIATKFNSGGVVIFDEIEAGLSSNISIKVASELYKMSKFLQIIAITHSPYIAGIADNQLQVAKSSLENSTITSILSLDDSMRLGEISRMISANPDKAAQDLATKILKRGVFSH